MTELEKAEERYESAVAQALKKKTARAALRAEMAEARYYGLVQRHAVKLARNRAQGQ